MRNRQLETLIQQSNNARKWFAYWFVTTLFSSFWVLFNVFNPPYNVVWFLIPWMLFGASAFIAVLHAFAYARYNELMHQLADNEPAAHDMLDFEQTTTPRVRLEAKHDNQLLRSRHEFTPSDWRLLIHALQPIRPRWTRDALHKTMLFPNITAPGEFERVCKEFQRMGVIKGKMYRWQITEQGWQDLHEVAHMTVVT